MNLKLIPILIALAQEAPSILSDIEAIAKSLEGNADAKAKFEGVITGLDKMLVDLLKVA